MILFFISFMEIDLFQFFLFLLVSIFKFIFSLKFYPSLLDFQIYLFSIFNSLIFVLILSVSMIVSQFILSYILLFPFISCVGWLVVFYFVISFHEIIVLF